MAAAGTFLWLGWLWLAQSWEVLDDDALAAKVSGRGQSLAVWLRARGWMGRGQRKLTYRRDERGRFRRIRR